MCILFPRNDPDCIGHVSEISRAIVGFLKDNLKDFKVSCLILDIGSVHLDSVSNAFSRIQLAVRVNSTP